MEDSSLTPRSWRDIGLLTVVPLLAFLSNLIYRIIRPKQSKAEEAKTAAEARLIDINATVVGTEQITKLAHLLAVADTNIERLKGQKDYWRNKATFERSRADAEQARADLVETELDRLLRRDKT